MPEPPKWTADLAPGLDPASRLCLERTRSWVLNVLIGVGSTIMASGLAFRFAGREAAAGHVEDWRRGLYIALIGVIVLSHLTRRFLGSRDRLRPPETRARRFLRSRVLAAVVGALAAALGLVYGLVVAPRLEEVVVFWAAALVLGILALPREIELGGFSEPMASEGNGER